MRMEHPDLVERVAYDYKEALMDFFEEKRNELDTHLVEWSSVERDRREIPFLNEFWFTRLQADKAATKAMPVNRVDMRKMGGLASSFPFTYAMMLMGSLSLIGFPFLTGFYSKDVILELAYTKYTISGNFAFWLGSVSVLFTSYYSFRSLFLTFLVPTNSFGRDILRCHDAPIPMAIPSILLALGSLFVGYLAKV
ncbi:hypothetical protein FEM48_ZijujUnG0020600 [Ziziphus jujuba var. spinosa]|uniref:NADH:quinone oxidoreductase/Mrp antiporter transmembrane domain-containing protein n=1 Tax=Ziziphus jujuba var. spinosa TaxID=714518 RepID=A0A978U9T1_ZIZJJ|nr:hypothetical protein FEM48_ZijujUnG0020600 [Ziziphus jujuba var. spinosa]